MSEDSKEARIVRKAVGEAETGLKGLEKELRGVVKQFEKGAMTPAKGKAAAQKVTAFMKKQSQVAKLQNAPFFGELPLDVQDGVTWLDSVVNELNNVLGRLAGALKLMQKKPDKDYGILVKASRELESYISQPPKGVGTLLKAAKAGKAAGDPMMAFLPFIILMWMIIDTIARGLNRRT
ncbi:hypothetical protein K3723_01350 [Leisingera caerulea]|uniref:hypothetical protein n=1 Tax=Leisingera caerulea TaxID=506591 RepID=UPI0021A34E48|nr:hypothetical protein [Leisingera caerulea]UWQ62978.1 hypothetical protein K3723_01350 [Leisingera caerulea]